MLYLSRFIGEFAYGIVDTDDDVETVVSRSELRNLVMKLGLKIEGIEVGGSYEGIKSMTVYQDPRYRTVAQTKAKAILGVDITLFRGEIVRIKLGDMALKAGFLRLRLSDYGTKIDGRCPITTPRGSDKFKLVLVLDDKIKVEDIAPKVGLNGLCIDISELSDENVVSGCYNGLAVTAGVDHEQWDEYLIDNGDRDLFWRYLYLLSQTYENLNKRFKELEHRGHKIEIAEKLEDKFFWDWAALTTVDLRSEFHRVLTRRAIEEFMHTYVDKRWKISKACNDYVIIRPRMKCLCTLLRVWTQIHAVDITRFQNYIGYFDVSPQVQGLCIELYNKICEAFCCTCKERGVKLPR